MQSQNERLKIHTTQDGSHTLYIPSLDEHYHSTHGSVQESQHVFIRAGFNAIQQSSVDILEVGLGTGLNALLTMSEAEKHKKKVFYYGIEKYPLPSEILEKLNYKKILKNGDDFNKIHACPWETEAAIYPWFSLYKTRADLLDAVLPDLFDLIYYDAFSPGVQPSLWEEPVLQKMAHVLRPGGVFITYCARGAVRRALVESGLKVERLPGPPGKREILRAVK
ncbi:MAG TPA: tRNA (5-methylaminomethyl-2-thiouridine)(34)-methyltransferase MnmD [Bacteroidales bacterium]|nr:tRNA (5-methylaminomethyl-2-thiouridine)(34)-methyltransferase MnmD [Bacteroidales bacterium]